MEPAYGFDPCFGKGLGSKPRDAHRGQFFVHLHFTDQLLGLLELLLQGDRFREGLPFVRHLDETAVSWLV